MFGITEFIKDLSKHISLLIFPKNIEKSPSVKRYEHLCDTWLVEGGFDYSERMHHNHDNHSCVFLRVRYKGKWYSVNRHGLPVGKPHTESTVSKWSFIKKIEN